MAVYYFRNTGDANWGTATNWSLTDGGGATGAVPTSADDAYFTANSGNCTINAIVRECFRLVTTGYTGTITTSNNLNVLSNCTLSSGTTISGTSNLVFATTTTATLTMNGASVTGVNEIRFFGSVTYTLADTWTVSNVRFSSNNTVLNSGTLNVTGNFTVAAQPAAGTTQINLTGTGTWSGNNAVQNPLTINTSGTITLSGTIQVNGGSTRSFTYSGGTIVTTGSTLILNAITLVGNWSSINFNNLTQTGAGTTTTLSSDLNVLGTFGFIGTSTVTLNGVYNINVSGNLTHSSSGVLGGQPTIILNGTGTWSNTSTGSLRLNVNINTSGTITLGSSISYANTTITYTTGTIVNTGSTLTLVSTTTLNTSGMTWNNVTISAGTITLNSTLNCNTLTFSNAVITFAGSAGFTTNTLINSTLTTSRTYTLKNSVNYIINNTLNLQGNGSNILTLTSDSGTVRANLLLKYGATQSVKLTNATRIDSSGGQTIYTTVSRTLTDTINWGKKEGTSWWQFLK
jgi:hypothetical protein